METPVRALVFDFDGLLVDSEGCALAACREVYHQHGHELPFDRWCQNVGTKNNWNPSEHLSRLMGGVKGAEELNGLYRARYLEILKTKDTMPGVREFLAAARGEGFRLGVASGSSAGWVKGHLEARGLVEMFTAIATRDGDMAVKPDPAVYQLCLQMLQTDAGEAVAFEDSPNGVAAAKNAGLRCVAVPNAVTRNLDFSRADLRLESLAGRTPREVLMMLGVQGVSNAPSKAEFAEAGPVAAGA